MNKFNKSFKVNNNFLSKLFDELLFIPRSITGVGFRKSLQIFKRFISFKIHKTKSGTKVFDWNAPPEWSVKEAYLKNPKGRIYMDNNNEDNSQFVKLVLDLKMPLKRELAKNGN